MVNIDFLDDRAPPLLGRITPTYSGSEASKLPVLNPLPLPLNAGDGLPAAHRPNLSPRQRLYANTLAVRTFYIFLWEHVLGITRSVRPGFFEHITTGYWLLLRRQRLVPQSLATGRGASFIPPRPVLTDACFFADELGHLQALPHPKSGLQRIFGAHAPALLNYAVSHWLRWDNASDLSALVIYGNSLPRH